MGYVKTISPTADIFMHYWRILAVREDGMTEVFWGHVRSEAEAEAEAERAPANGGARHRGWKSFALEIADFEETLA